jgi:hypothetical protein
LASFAVRVFLDENALTSRTLSRSQFIPSPIKKPHEPEKKGCENSPFYFSSCADRGLPNNSWREIRSLHLGAIASPATPLKKLT